MWEAIDVEDSEDLENVKKLIDLKINWLTMKTTLLLFGLLGFFIQNQAQTVADMEGNVYNAIAVGTQVWTINNLTPLWKK